MVFRRADLGVELRVIGDVVTVVAARRGLQIGRSVAVGDAKLGKIGDDRGGISEGEAGMELEAIGRPRHRPPTGDPLAGRGEKFPGVGREADLTFQFAPSFDGGGHQASLPAARPVHPVISTLVRRHQASRAERLVPGHGGSGRRASRRSGSISAARPAARLPSPRA